MCSFLYILFTAFGLCMHTHTHAGFGGVLTITHLFSYLLKVPCVTQYITVLMTKDHHSEKEHNRIDKGKRYRWSQEKIYRLLIFFPSSDKTILSMLLSPVLKNIR